MYLPSDAIPRNIWKDNSRKITVFSDLKIWYRSVQTSTQQISQLPFLTIGASWKELKTTS
jgi:hypothetical protein